MKFIIFSILFILFSKSVYSYVDKTGDDLCISTCINFDSCLRNGTSYKCDCPANVTQKHCTNNSVFCSPSPCTICNTTFSFVHAFGYECLCDNQIELFYCKDQDEIIEMIGIFGEFFGKLIGGIVGGVMVGFFIIMIICCGGLCFICLCCIKCIQMIKNSSNGNRSDRNHIQMNPVVTPGQNYEYHAVNDEKQKFIPIYPTNQIA